MMKCIFLFLVLLSSKTWAQPGSCIDLLADKVAAAFTKPVICRGSAIDQVSGARAEFVIQLNSVYAEEDGSVLDSHLVSITTKTLGFIPSTSEYAHVSYNQSCRRQGERVTCTGHGNGTVLHDMEITVDLNSGQATGFYKSNEYPNPSYNPSYVFTPENALRCENANRRAR